MAKGKSKEVKSNATSKVSRAKPARKSSSAAPFVPDSLSIKRLAEASDNCKGCELYLPATQVVFGEGPSRPDLLVIGECPGDMEDREGRPFVGPAGRLLKGALDAVSSSKVRIYYTNAVKHFPFSRRGSRRIHQKPKPAHIAACRPWLMAQLQALRPSVVLCLGTTAARSMLGHSVTLKHCHGKTLIAPTGQKVIVTFHPSYLLRLKSRSGYDETFTQFIADLRRALHETGGPSN